MRSEGNSGQFVGCVKRSETHHCVACEAERNTPLRRVCEAERNTPLPHPHHCKVYRMVRFALLHAPYKGGLS